jgi:hypothetical protein
VQLTLAIITTSKEIRLKTSYCLLFLALITFKVTSIEIPNNAKLNHLGSDWVCMKGFHLSGQQCLPVEVPESAKLTYLGNDWECKRGFRQTGQECLGIQIPDNAKLTYIGNDWECKKGFHLSEQQCFFIELPDNAKLNYLGDGWECVRGYDQKENKCTFINVPTNAQLTSLGDEWLCKRGFRQSGKECLSIKIPDNATFTIQGDEWECIQGYLKAGDYCRKSRLSNAEKRQRVGATGQYIEAISDGTIAYETRVSESEDEIIILENGAVVEIATYLGYVGYRKTAYLFGTGSQCKIWISGKGTYLCTLLKIPEVRGQPAKSVFIMDVKANGNIIVTMDGGIYEVDSMDVMKTSMWMHSEGLLVNGKILLNFSTHDHVQVSIIR